MEDHFDLCGPGKRGMKRGTIWTVIILAGAWLIAGWVGVGL